MCYFSVKFGYFFIWLAGKICVWRVADLLAIFAIFRRKIWRIFVQDLDQCLFHEKVVKLHIILYTAAKFIVSECVRSVQWNPRVWLGFGDQLVP